MTIKDSIVNSIDQAKKSVTQTAEQVREQANSATSSEGTSQKMGNTRRDSFDRMEDARDAKRPPSPMAENKHPVNMLGGMTPPAQEGTHVRERSDSVTAVKGASLSR